MPTYEDSYSRLISWLKIILPLIALAMLSTLFLVAKTVEPSQSIPYADVDASELAKAKGMSTPNYSSVSSDGAAITMTAKSALPLDSEASKIIAKSVNAHIEQPNGQEIFVTATEGLINDVTGLATLTGDVEITTSDGYVLVTQKLVTKMDGSDITSNTDVSAQGPIGTIDAGAMHIWRDPQSKTQDGYLMVFKEGVKMVYLPKKD